MDTSRTSPRSLRTTPAFRLPLLASVALVSSLALGGCTSNSSGPETTSEAPATFKPGPVTEFVPPPAELQKAVACPASTDDLPTNSDMDYPKEPRGSVPEGFVVEKVFICRTADLESATKPGVKQEELQGDFAPLLKALAVPSDRAEGNQAVCNAILEMMPIVWLVNTNGDAVDAALPTTECRQASAKPDTHKAIDALTVANTTIVQGTGK